MKGCITLRGSTGIALAVLGKRMRLRSLLAKRVF
jgi:hypothetical protein